LLVVPCDTSLELARRINVRSSTAIAALSDAPPRYCMPLQKPLGTLEVVSAEPIVVSESRACEAAAAGMTSPLIPKRNCEAQISDPLCDAGILEHVLCYHGPGVWLYIGAVSNLWKQFYEKNTLDEAKRIWQPAVVTEPPHKTTYSAVMQSVATLTWAYMSGLRVDAPGNRGLQYAAGRHASLLTLTVAHELGMPMSAHVFAGAVASGREPIVDHLYTTHQCFMADDIGHPLAKKGNITMLKYLKQRGYALSARLAINAAPAGNLRTMKYLRSEGCSWLQDTQVIGWAAHSDNLEMVSWYMFVFRSTKSHMDC
jgi:hypothetical protein